MKWLTIIAVVLPLLLVGAVASTYYALWVPGRSHDAARLPPTAEESALAERLKAHIVTIASEPHNVKHPAALERSAVAVEASFKSAGYEPQSQRYLTDSVEVRNIWVTIEPQNADGADALVIGAHYDSAGIAPGAGDNGSGTASLLELAGMLHDWKPDRTRIYLVAFVNEENPYWGTPDHGAARFADLLIEKGERVRGMVSLETIGWFSDKPGSQRYPFPFNHVYDDVANFVAFVAMPGSRDFLHEVIGTFRRHAAIPTIGGVAPSVIPGIAWSDHAAFAKRSIPALMITDTAPFRYPHYHRATDTPDKINVEALARVTIAFEKTVRDLAK